MLKIKKIHALSVAKILGLIYAIVGIIFGIIISLFSLATGKEIPGGIFSNIVLLPLRLSIMSALSGFVFALIYNNIANKIGGIEIDIEVDSEKLK